MSCPIHCFPSPLVVSLCLLVGLLGLIFLAPALMAEVEGEDLGAAAESLRAEVERKHEKLETLADEAEALVQEVIIDDSGIILKEGDQTIHMEDDEGGGISVEVRGGTLKERYEHQDEDEQVYFGKDVVIAADEIVHNDMVILFGDIDIHGKLVGDMFVFNGDVSCYDGAEVTGDILCVGGTVHTDPDVRVIGEIKTVSTRLLDLPEEALGLKHGIGFGRPVFRAREASLTLLEMLILAWVGLLLMAARLPNLSAGLRQRPWYSLLVGLLSSLALVLLLIPALLVIVLLVLTLVGIPVAILAILAIGGIVFLAWLVPLYTLSRYTFESRGLNRFLSVGIWTAIFWLVHILGRSLGSLGPGVLVIVLEVLVMVGGLGALVLTRFGARKLVPVD